MKILLPKKPGSNINLIYSNNNGHSALLNIIMELERALGILLETTVNYYKDNIDTNIQQSTENVKCKWSHLVK